MNKNKALTLMEAVKVIHDNAELFDVEKWPKLFKEQYKRQNKSMMKARVLRERIEHYVLSGGTDKASKLPEPEQTVFEIDSRLSAIGLTKQS